MLNKIIFSLLTLSLTLNANKSQTKTLTSQIKLTSTLTNLSGEIINLKIIIKYNIPGELLLNKIKSKNCSKTLYKDFLFKKDNKKVTEIRHIYYKHKKEKIKSQTTESFSYKFQIFESESLLLKAIPITLLTNSKQSPFHKFQTPLSFIHLTNLLTKEEIIQLQNPYSPKTNPHKTKQLLTLLSLLLILITAITFITIRIKNFILLKKTKLYSIEKESQIKLNKLKNHLTSPSHQNSKNIYINLLKIIKTFLERKYNIRTQEKTTLESIELIKSNLKDKNYKKLITEKLKHYENQIYQNQKEKTFPQLESEIKSLENIIKSKKGH